MARTPGSALVFGMAFLLCGGCGLTRQVRVEYVYSGLPLSSAQKVARGLEVAPFKDQRNLINPRELMATRNVFGYVAMRFVAERPIAEIVSDAIRDELSRTGLSRSTMPTDCVLEGEVLEFFATVEMGTLNAPSATTVGSTTVYSSVGIPRLTGSDSELAVKLRLVDKSTAIILWEAELVGHYRDTEFRDFPTENFREALDEIIYSVTQSESLSAVLAHGRQDESLKEPMPVLESP